MYFDSYFVFNQLLGTIFSINFFYYGSLFSLVKIEGHIECPVCRQKTYIKKLKDIKKSLILMQLMRNIKPDEKESKLLDLELNLNFAKFLQSRIF